MLMERKNGGTLGCLIGLSRHGYAAATARGKLVPACVRNNV